MMRFDTERTLRPVRGILAVVVLLLCVTAAAPVAAVGLDGSGESFSPFWTVLEWLGLTEVVVAVVGEVPGEGPTFEKEGGDMDPNGVYGAEDDHFAPDWPAAVLGSGGS